MLTEAVIEENSTKCVLKVSTKCLNNTNEQKIHTHFLCKVAVSDRLTFLNFPRVLSKRFTKFFRNLEFVIETARNPIAERQMAACRLIQSFSPEATSKCSLN